MTTQADAEAAISAQVRRFYDLCFADDILAPMFRAAIPDLEAHLRIVSDFWSHALLGTSRYDRGTPYSHHMQLEVEEVHFERWMAAFTQAAREILPEPLCEAALKRAAHMTASFKMGMLPLPTPAPRKAPA